MRLDDSKGREGGGRCDLSFLSSLLFFFFFFLSLDSFKYTARSSFGLELAGD